MPLSPMMQRYVDLKEHYKDCIVFYRLGDFYEMFFDDAKIASKELSLALTGRDCGLTEKAPMCGVPHHSVNTYINKLLAKNYKVAICEQLSDPKASKGLVERGIVRVVTPGTIIEDDMLEEKSNNFLASVYLQKDKCGISWADVSTGEFNTCTVDGDMTLSAVTSRLLEINPTEILVNREFFERADAIPQYIRKQLKPFACSTLFDMPENGTESDVDKNFLERFKDFVKISKKNIYSTKSSSALWAYLLETQKNVLAHMNKIGVIEDNDHLILDATAIKNLELFTSMGDHGTRGTLLWLLDKTETPMGGRKLKSFLERPLRNKEEINKRLDGVEELKNNFALREDLKEALSEISDIERICTRVSYGTVNARETVFMRKSLKNLPQVKALLENSASPIVREIFENIDTLQDIYQLLDSAIADDPSDSITEGGIIKKGYDEDLDKYRDAVENGQNWILRLENQYREETEIKNLKIKYNKVFGYSIEVTNSFKDKVPYTFIRRQTLAGAERYTTDELKKTEELISGSAEKAIRLEYTIFTKIRETLFEAIFRIRKTSEALSVLDVLLSLSNLADENNYVRPQINTEGKIEIFSGRHPVIEAMQKELSFVPNDTFLDNGDNRFMVITGPNMAGKSTYMRQTALITLMAHLGSFVPAQSANISVCDRIFTRVGASDDLSAGQSTFMLEMTEVADIIKNATKDSLIILDEIGRGTSTFDGLSIAWAVTEYISDKKYIGAKTLFATHYHELSELEGTLEGVKNYCITAKEYGDDVIFLRKIVRGSADKSFGIAVAHLAGIPKPVLNRAKDILFDLEKADITRATEPNAMQTTMFVSDNTVKIIDELKQVDVNTLTPIQAINILCELREKAKRET